MSQRSQVGADLVGTPGARDGLDQGAVVIAFQHAQVGLGELAVLRVDHGAMAAVAVWAQGQQDLSGFPVWQAVHQGMVNLLGLPAFKLQVERPVGSGAAGEHDHAAGLFI